MVNMKKSAKLIEKGFMSSSETTTEFKSFCRTFNSEFKKLAGSLGCTDVKLKAGHFYISGFFTAPNGQVWYVALNDVRWSNGQMYFRTAKDYKDYKGGDNINTNINDIEEDLVRYIK